MSEYQLYEFQSIDRTLTPADRQYLRGLSSRVEVTATSARFNYSYGDCRGDPIKVLERCFDILLYPGELRRSATGHPTAKRGRCA